jgi:hypothetical protein
LEGGKKGDPKNEGMSKDVDENKGQINWPWGCLKMLLKNKVFTFPSRDVNDNKWD